MASSLTSVCTATVLVDNQGERGKSGAVKEGSVQRGSNPDAGLLVGYQFHSGLITAVYRFHSVRDRSEKARGHIYIGPPPQLLNNVKVCGPALSSKRSCSRKWLLEHVSLRLSRHGEAIYPIWRRQTELARPLGGSTRDVFRPRRHPSIRMWPTTHGKGSLEATSAASLAASIRSASAQPGRVR